ncbi:efflux RND transporter permease subunit [Propionivibrio sp.]|uniref:efflux RND transporter permease subunit n=1 Tax=Propionivibrio sp. TaxID=2212460 RepID=UPI0025E6CFD1|nr:efflux RND transporter permease subunit [Propionivibrio sp.]MBK8402165.1 efflux RND transporter permease subunit [Propionivibrio sp.]MBK8745851.1 efflux RND transporter permease subunit [Propionivibrio sp.]MBK8893452.1 efflux RND transporter permease subunit [Propionivibrio sp.]
MNVSTWSIRNPIPVVLLFLMLTVLGLMAFKGMKVQQFPDIDLPTVTITANLPGAAPAQMETEVGRKIENAVATLQGVKHIYTKAQEGTVVVSVEFRLEKPTQEGVDDVRDAISRIRADLPGELKDPVIARVNLAGAPILTYTVASTRMDDEALSWLVDNTLTRAMLSVRGVGAVARVGGVTREIRIELDPARLLALRATAADVSRQLRQMQQDASGGRSDIGGIEQTLRTIATVHSAEEIGAMEIALADGRRVRLSDLATVSDTVSEQRSAALLNGKPVVGFEIVRARGAGEVEVAEGVRAVLEKLKAEHPDITITEAFNFVDPVVENFDGSMALLIEGAILAVIVVWLFLRDWRATIVSATALPLSIIPTFAAMSIMGFTLNVVTLLSMSLVVGILVDDAIVEIENIMRHLRMGKTPLQAAIEAADEIGLAVIATTSTLIAVFLPTAFMGGVPGKFFVQFGWTAAIAVFFSLVVARMLTPMMAAYILCLPKKEHREPRWMEMYTRWATWCLKHRVLTTIAALVFFFGSFALVPLLPTGFVPPDDLSQTQVYLSLQPGSTFKETLAAAEEARRIVEKNRYVKLVYTAIGGGASGSDPFSPQGAAEVRKATLTINMTPRKERGGVKKQAVERQLRDALAVLPGVQIKVGLGGSNEKYVLVLASEDGDLLAKHARIVERELRTIPGIGAVTSTASLVRPELVVRPDFARAADLGVTSAAIADVLRIATIGDYDQNIAKLNLAQRQIPIVVKLPAEARQDLSLLERLTVAGKHGPVMIGSVAKLSMAGGPAEINRYDRLRNINFEIELNQQPLGEVEKQTLALPSLKNLPPGILQTTVGDAEAMGDLFSSFALAMLTGVMCIYVVLVLLFKDFVQPVTILTALVLSVPGAFLALFVTQTALSMPSMIGLIMLMGIATKNSILLIDYVILARRGIDGQPGLDRWHALLDASRKRARPIVMTTVAMGAGMLPIALGVGTDPSFRAPMAIVVIGGLITSTFLSLLVIPVVFTYVDDVMTLLRNVLAKRGRKG